MTTYPAAVYVPVLDGVAGSFSFVTTTSGGTYAPDGTSYSNIVTSNFATTPAIMEILAASPSATSITGGTASWQTSSGSFSWAYGSDHKLILSFNGSLPALVGVQPAGWVLRERGWSSETVPNGSGLITARAFYDADDPNTINSIPDNKHPVFIVPYYGNYTTSNGLTLAVSPITLTGATSHVVSDAVITVTLPKPLNPNQTLTGMTMTPSSNSGAGSLAIPNTPYNMLGNTTITSITNGSGQITGFTITVPLSQSTPASGGGVGQIVPGNSYNFSFVLSETLQYLRGNSVVTGTVSICSGSVALAVPYETVGPNITSAVLSSVSGTGIEYYSSTQAATFYLGDCQIAYNATDPEGVNPNPVITFSGIGTVSATGAGSGPWTTGFSTENAASFTDSAVPIQITLSNKSSQILSTTADVTADQGGSIVLYSRSWIVANTVSTIASPYPVVLTVPVPPALVNQVIMKASGTYNSTGITHTLTIPDLGPGGSYTIDGSQTVQNVDDKHLKITIAWGMDFTESAPGEADVTTTDTYECSVRTKLGTYIRVSASRTRTLPGYTPPSCFAAGTMVTMADFTEKPIEDICVGDEVLCYDDETNTQVVGIVDLLESPIRNNMYSLSFSNGRGLRVTSEHPIRGADGWKAIDPEAAKIETPHVVTTALVVGDQVQTQDGTLTELVSLQKEDVTRIQTYNLKKVRGYHTFYADGILAHNKCCVRMDSLITTPEGLKQIMDLRMHDLVLTHDFAENVNVPSRIVGRTRTLRAEHHKVEAVGTELFITGDHPMYSPEKGWSIIDPLEGFNIHRALYDIELSRATTGDSIMSGSTPVRTLTSIEKVEGVLEMHTLTVAHPDHNFYANDLLVHNDSSGGNCFLPGTPVATPDGPRSIEDLHLTDLVYSYDRSTGETVEAPVIALVEMLHATYYRIELEDGVVLNVTEDHPLLEATKGWVNVNPSNLLYRKVFGITFEAITVGDRLVSPDGTGRKVVAITQVSAEEREMYTIGVAGHSTFIASGVVVHDGYHTDMS